MVSLPLVHHKDGSIERTHVQLQIHDTTPLEIWVNEMYQTILFLPDPVKRVWTKNKKSDTHWGLDSRYTLDQLLLLTIRHDPPILGVLEDPDLVDLRFELFQPSFAMRRQVESGIIQ